MSSDFVRKIHHRDDIPATDEPFHNSRVDDIVSDKNEAWLHVETENGSKYETLTGSVVDTITTRSDLLEVIYDRKKRQLTLIPKDKDVVKYVSSTDDNLLEVERKDEHTVILHPKYGRAITELLSTNESMLKVVRNDDNKVTLEPIFPKITSTDEHFLTVKADEKNNTIELTAKEDENNVHVVASDKPDLLEVTRPNSHALYLTPKLPKITSTDENLLKINVTPQNEIQLQPQANQFLPLNEEHLKSISFNGSNYNSNINKISKTEFLKSSRIELSFDDLNQNYSLYGNINAFVDLHTDANSGEKRLLFNNYHYFNSGPTTITLYLFYNLNDDYIKNPANYNANSFTIKVFQNNMVSLNKTINLV